MMKPNMQELLNVGLKVRTPLTLAGLAMVILYLIYKEVLSLNIFEKIGSNATFLVIQNILDKIFWLALIAIVLGVGTYLATILLAHKSKSLASNVTLIDASLDPHDSPYEQRIEGGRKKIHYKKQQGRTKFENEQNNPNPRTDHN